MPKPAYRSCLIVLLACHWTNLSCPSAIGDGPADNRADQVREIPPPGVEIDQQKIETLAWRCKAIRSLWQALLLERKNVAEQNSSAISLQQLESLTSEVVVFARAVELAIEFGQFYNKQKDPEAASKLLDEATRRMSVIRNGGDWADMMGIDDGGTPQLIVGGFQSKIDGSIQPYAIVLPIGLGRDDDRPRQLDLWFHGRGEKLSEIAFLSKQRTDYGQYAPRDTIVLHPYGRYSNAFKLAGEIDVLEALAYVSDRLHIDSERISVRGFSMGGRSMLAIRHALRRSLVRGKSRCGLF